MARLRVVASTVSPMSFASAAAVMPTELVPPRMRMLCPDSHHRPVVSEPRAVWYISGSAPNTSHGSSVRTVKTWEAGTRVSSA